MRPPEDYTRVEVRGVALNTRTIAMLQHAQTLYGGSIDMTNQGITQGSYNAGGVALSFGTHDGGGAVDISVRDLPHSWDIRWEDIPRMIDALRRAGFAAYYRDEADGMSPHIHAIAVGDADLSRAAALQLTGRYGYFRGFDALPQPDGVPQPDDSGELILCNWMRELGYEDLREAVTLYTPPYEFIVGELYQINMTWGQELNMRSGPGLAFPVVHRLPHEIEVTMVDGPRRSDGFTWWLVRLTDGTLGWSVDAIDGALTIVR
ncbi:MAG: SH3 domain-containing protein [Anaerolineae bacterium]|nr:SH3 domain-containing protein [Anaerolineae bacterium]